MEKGSKGQPATHGSGDSGRKNRPEPRRCCLSGGKVGVLLRKAAEKGTKTLVGERKT